MAASKLSNEEKLLRLLYLGRLDAKYICGGFEKYESPSQDKTDFFSELLKTSHTVLLKQLEAVNNEKLIPCRSQLFSILAFAVCLPTTSNQIKPELCGAVLKLCKTDQDFFDFIKFVSLYRTICNKSKIPHTVAKHVSKFYTQKTAQELAKSYTMRKSYHKWSHKDLMKVGHVKADTIVKQALMNYILYKNVSEDANQEAKTCIELMQKSEQLRSAKEPTVALPIINELKATIHQVEPSLRKSADVWHAVLPNMPLSEVLYILPKLYKLGFLKKETPTLSRINEALNSSDRVRASGIHPIEVFIHMKNFEKGGKPLDPKLLDHLVKERNLTEAELAKLKTPNEAKCPIVMGYLQKCMNLSCSNVQPCNKRFLITIDVTDKIDTPCLRNRNITGIEVAAAFAWFLLRVEKDVIVAVFKDKDIYVVHLDKKGHLNEHVSKLKEHKSKFLVLSSPIEWAMSQKKHIDVFINFIHHKDYYSAIPKEVKEKMSKPVDTMHRFRKKFNLMQAKLINVCLSYPHMVTCDGSPNILDVAGLDEGVPKVIEAFYRGNFC
ncbi:unnamed protein product [Acanthoscelides obtectus]|uniref:TROVE domain-containing protein n=1 Tax=Acanthoscelides obtectus TaxID=200917 RepID=A0A9P0PCB6_ACAOB|nr:unnamed protein product [Acanthoscelides obtectus]CAK1670230.1 60 kDa SS-A/Ro ribonucleoprotein [Acanthoscelides obtectus]